MCRAFILRSVITLLVIGSASASFAQLQLKQRNVGDWTAYERPSREQLEKLRSEEVSQIASTSALNGRKAALGINSCGAYSVSFAIYTDSEFDGPPNPDDQFKIIETKTVFTKVLPSERKLAPTVLERGEADYFLEDADWMASGSKYLICPSQEEGPRCLTFSLRGITAALKMVCPKR